MLSNAEEILLAGLLKYLAGAETFEILDNSDIIFPKVKDDQGGSNYVNTWKLHDLYGVS